MKCSDSVRKSFSGQFSIPYETHDVDRWRHMPMDFLSYQSFMSLSDFETDSGQGNAGEQHSGHFDGTLCDAATFAFIASTASFASGAKTARALTISVVVF